MRGNISSMNERGRGTGRVKQIRRKGREMFKKCRVLLQDSFKHASLLFHFLHLSADCRKEGPKNGKIRD